MSVGNGGGKAINVRLNQRAHLVQHDAIAGTTIFSCEQTESRVENRVVTYAGNRHISYY